MSLKICINDFYHRTILKTKLLFTRDENKRKTLLIAIALFSKEGRKILSEAMIGGAKDEITFKTN